ncbi:glycerate dehydrogenase [Xylariaceae sp. FL0594]|nr:glycerate dehydrogenase [Xylariaceae sp. FL0594]
MAQQTHWVIVALNTFFCPWGNGVSLPPPHTWQFRDYEATRPDQVAERIRDADIVITTLSPITAEILKPEVTPRLKMISVIASGTDAVDLAACRSRGIVVGNAPHCNEETVAEHALALYFATRRSVLLTHSLVRSGAWATERSHHKTMDRAGAGRPPMTTRDEVFGIVGYGSVGRAFEAKVRALGMRTIVAARKGAVATEVGEGRVPFEEVIRACSVLLICVPRSPETLNLISDPEFDQMTPHTLVINVSRGGIVDERALVAALKEGRIAGAGTDVFAQEPAEPGSSLLLAPETENLNLVMTPHVAWYGAETLDNYRRACEANLAEFVTNGKAKYQVC